MLILGLLMGCMEHGMHPQLPEEDPLQYQAQVLEFMCSQTCEWQDVDTCWSELSAHWAFCVSGSEHLDAGRVEDCVAIMEDTVPGECAYLPAECLVSAVTLPARGTGEDCISDKVLAQ